MEKKKNNKFILAIILIAIILLAIVWLIVGGNKKGAQKAEPDVPNQPDVPTQPVALNILVEEQSDEPYPYDDVSVLYGIWKATDADYIKKEGQEGYANFEKDSEYNELSEFYLLFKEDNTVFIYDGYEKKSEKVYYEAEMMEEFDGQVNVIVYEIVNNNSILRKFSLDHQTKILTLAYIEERGVADVYFKKINSSTDESVFK